MSSFVMKSVLGVGICMTVALPCLSGNAWAGDTSTSTKYTAFMKQYRRAMKLAKQEEWDDAVEAFKAAYESQPTERPEIHLYIAKAYVKLGEGKDALKYYGRFLREAKTMTPAQRAELDQGMKDAQLLLEEGAKRRERRAREAGKEEALGMSRTNISQTVTQPLGGGVDGGSTGSDAAVVRQDVQPSVTSLPASTTPNYKVEAQGRNRGMHYSVHISTGTEMENSVCSTPCTLRAPAGPALVTVSGPGSKQFEKEVTLPPAPSRLQVQHFTLSRAIAGPILLALSSGFLAGGVLLLTFDRSLSSGSIFGATPLLLHGTVFFFTGIGQLASIKRNSVNVLPLGSLGSTLPAHASGSRIQLSSVSLSPTADRKGMTAGLSFRF